MSGHTNAATSLNKDGLDAGEHSLEPFVSAPDAGGPVLIRILRIGALSLRGFQFGVLGLKGVGDILEKDQAEDDVLVLGRVHVVAQGIGGDPELGLEAEVRGGGVFFWVVPLTL